MTDTPFDQLIRLNDWLAEHEPDAYHTDEDTEDTTTIIIGLLTGRCATFESCNRARQLAEAEVDRLRAELDVTRAQALLVGEEIANLQIEVERLRAALDATPKR